MINLSTVGDDTMPRRAVVVFFIFCLLMGVVCLQLISVSTGLDTAAGTVKNTRSIELSDLGAPIYDCNGRLITNGYTEYFAAARPTAAALSELRKKLDDDDFEQAREKLSKGRPVAVRVPSGESGCENNRCRKAIFSAPACGAYRRLYELRRRRGLRNRKVI